MERAIVFCLNLMLIIIQAVTYDNNGLLLKKKKIAKFWFVWDSPVENLEKASQANRVGISSGRFC